MVPKFVKSAPIFPIISYILKDFIYFLNQFRELLEKTIYCVFLNIIINHDHARCLRQHGNIPSGSDPTVTAGGAGQQRST